MGNYFTSNSNGNRASINSQKKIPTAAFYNDRGETKKYSIFKDF